MANYTTVFFDVGNTLLTPAIDESRVFVAKAAHYGIELDQAEVEANIPWMYRFYEELYTQDDTFWADEKRAMAIWEEMYEALAHRLGIDHLAQALARAVHEVYLKPESWKPFDDVLPTLDALQERGITMGLISNWDSSLIAIIEGLGMGSYFKAVIASAVVNLKKPDAPIFELALDLLGAQPKTALHVGDHITADVEGARAVGITPVLLDRARKHTAVSCRRVEALTDLLGLL
jgi:putative hydrolase of the HAD superfamily